MKKCLSHLYLIFQRKYEPEHEILVCIAYASSLMVHANLVVLEVELLV